MNSLFLCFFFSSRRRHTRLQGDWSSDVCSSDLGAQLQAIHIHSSEVTNVAVSPDGQRAISRSYDDTLKVWEIESARELLNLERRPRSEERRVGKECRSRWATAHDTKRMRMLYGI